MTLELNKDQEVLLDRVLDSGQFKDAQGFLDYALTMALMESETFAEAARAMLSEAQADKEAGRVTKIPHGELLNVLKQRQAKS